LIYVVFIIIISELTTFKQRKKCAFFDNQRIRTRINNCY